MSTAVATGAAGLLDDFEDGDAMVANNDGRGGGWWFSKSMSAVTMPDMGGPPTPVEGGAGATPGKAIHVSGSDTAAMGWGADVSATFVSNGMTGCYDASAYTGLKLALKGKAGSKVFVTVRIAAIRAIEGMAGHYRKEVTLTNAWQDVAIKWNEFGPGWGTPPEPKMVNPREIYAVGVATAPGSDGKVGEFDIWIDNVEFTK
jgi:hypothetical protein